MSYNNFIVKNGEIKVKQGCFIINNGKNQMNEGEFIVYYGKVQVKRGNFIDMFRATYPPTIYYFPLQKKTCYCILMVDMDSPNRKNPIYKYWLHWMVCNIQYSINPLENYNIIYTNVYGQTIIDYMEPSPSRGTGPHRYILLLYKQPFMLNFNYEPYRRRNFNVKKFVKKYNLELVSLIHFKCEYPKYDDYI
jgi:large subunit ribosomal protein L35